MQLNNKLNPYDIMKRIFILGILLFLVTFSIAQTQQGYVRTLGRPEKKGEALGGVTIRVKGEHNHILSKEDGTFSMLMPDKKNGDAYSLQLVQKNGYELNETDIIGRQFAFSDKVVLTIVMVSLAQLQADKQRIEDNAYKRAEKDFKAKAELLEKQLRDNNITIQQYNDSILVLQDKLEKYQSLIDGLAEHYAHTDYDMLNEIDREINICIENGDLERADSLIRTLFDPIEVLKRNKEALARLDQQISEAGNIIAQANEDMAAVLKQQEKDAEYLYQLYTIALAKYDQQKASQYIETRALLDTTNGRWQFDAAVYLSQQNKFKKAENYYLRALDIYNKTLGQDSLPYLEIDKIYALNNLSILYTRIQRFSDCEPLLLEASDLCTQLFKEDSALYYSQSVSLKLFTIGNLCNYYHNTNQFTKAANWAVEGINTYNDYMNSEVAHTISNSNVNRMYLQLFYNLIELCNSGNITSVLSKRFIENVNLFEFMEVVKEVKDYDDDYQLEVYGPIFSNLVLSISKLYTAPQYQSEREEMLQIALDINRKLTKNNPQAFEPDLVNYINSMAEFLSETNRFQESEALYEESLMISRRLAKDNPPAYMQLLLNTLCSMGAFYMYTNRFIESEQMFREALQIEQSLINTNPGHYEFSYARTLNDLALVLSYMQQFGESESLYLESIELSRQNAQHRSDSLVFKAELAPKLYNLATLYLNTNRLQESMQMYEEVIRINRQLVASAPSSEEFESNLVQSLCELSALYLQFQRFDETKSILDEALERGEKLAANNPELHESLLAYALNDNANYNRAIGNYQESQKQYQRALDIYRRLARKYPDIPMPQLVSCLIDNSLLCNENQQYKESELLLEEALLLCRQFENDNPETFIDLHVLSASLLSELYYNSKEHPKAFQLLAEIVPSLKSLYLENPDLWQERYVMVLGDLSYYALFNKKYAQSEQYAIDALTIDPSQQWIFSNLAAGQLFQGKYAEAEEIYRSFKNELKDGFLQDFDDFEAAGIIPKERKADVERIKKILNE